MKKNELQYRILTSFVLLPIVVLMLWFNKFYLVFFVGVVITVAIYEWISINKKKVTFISVLGIFFLLLSFFFSLLLRESNKEVPILLSWILFVCFFSDIGGFIFGKYFKGKKITKLSPNKTYAGVYGSFIFSLFPVLFLNYLPFLSFNSIINLSFKNIILSLFFSFICQIGDIIISYFKRKNKIKDTGDILPGHGGILDRIDGIIFVIVAAGFLKLFQII